MVADGDDGRRLRRCSIDVTQSPQSKLLLRGAQSAWNMHDNPASLCHGLMEVFTTCVTSDVRLLLHATMFYNSQFKERPRLAYVDTTWLAACARSIALASAIPLHRRFVLALQNEPPAGGYQSDTRD